MVEYTAPALDAIYRALGDATRLQMLRQLSRGERTVGQLAEPFAMSLAAASKHVRALESAGLVRRDVRGRTHVCRLEPAPLAKAHEWLTFYETFWTDRLGRLDELLRADDVRKPASTAGTRTPKKTADATRQPATAKATPAATKAATPKTPRRLQR